MRYRKIEHQNLKKGGLADNACVRVDIILGITWNFVVRFVELYRQAQWRVNYL